MLALDRWKLIGWRLLQFVPVIVMATFIVFGLMQLVPGDIAVTLAGENPSAARIAELRGLLGLDRQTGNEAGRGQSHDPVATASEHRASTPGWGRDRT